MIQQQQQSTRPPDASSSQAWSHQAFGDQNFWSARGLLSWWYRWTAPAEAPAGASFQQRDLVRRGRIASAILLFLTGILFIVAPLGWFGPNKQIFYTALLVWATIAVCIVLNRRKHVNLVGVLICLAMNLGMYLSILRAPGGLGVDEKDIFYLLCFSELFVGAILPTPWILVPLVINLLFCGAELTFAPHTPQMEALLQTSRFTILFRVFQIHALIAGVLWILNAHARASIQRADRAEEVARLHHDMGHLAAGRAQEAGQLKQAISELVSTLTQVMRGNLGARVPHQQGGTFWTLGGMLNNLLTRYQRAVVDAREVQTLRLAVHQHKASHQIAQRLTQEQTLIQEAVAQALREQRPFTLPEDLVLLEPFFHLLQGYSLVPAAVESAQPEASPVPNSVGVAKLPLSPTLSGPASLQGMLTSPLEREGRPLAPPVSAHPSQLHQQQVAVPVSFSLPISSFHPTSEEVHDDAPYRQYL